MNSFKGVVIVIYIIVGIIYTLYGSFFGEYAHNGFFYNLGRGIIWPATMFPIVGKTIGAIIILFGVLWLTFKR